MAHKADTLAEIEDAIAGHNAKVDELKTELRVLNRTRDALLAQAQTAAKIAAMSPAEREAMKAALAAG